MTPRSVAALAAMDELRTLTRDLNLHVPPSYFPSSTSRLPYEEALAPIVAADPAPAHLYIGVPLCEEHCRFCMYFYGFADAEGSAAEACTRALEHFLEAMRPDVERRIAGMYVGGGTPTVLEADQIERLLRAVNATFTFEADAQLTFEMSPRSFTRAKAEAIAAGGVRRVSFGLQSFDPEPVARANRGYVGPEAIGELLRDCLEVGMEDVNADLMVGLEGESDRSLAESVDLLLDLGCPTISIYRYRTNRSAELKGQGGLDAYVATCDRRVQQAVDVATSRGRAVVGRTDGEHVRLVAPGPCPWPDRNIYDTRFRPSLGNSLVGIGSGARSFLRDERIVHNEHRRADGFELAGRLVEVEDCDEESRVAAALVNAFFRDLWVDLEVVSTEGRLDPLRYFGPQLDQLTELGVLERDGARLSVRPEHRADWAYWDKLLYPEAWLRRRRRSRKLRVR